MQIWLEDEKSKDNWFANHQLHSIDIFDTQKNSIIELRISDKVNAVYICGLTPYDSAHLGHAFTYSVFDILIRFLRQSGKNVKYVQNITDIDDPLFERARRDNQPWREIADNQIKKFVDDMQSISINPPDIFVAVSEEIETISTANSELKQANYLYSLETDWYFNLTDFHHPLISNYSHEQLIEIFAERGGDPERVGKLHKLDPLVWKRSLTDEPSYLSELGKGRPGWHIECVAIMRKYLDLPLLVQGGGKDLIFPHHTMCAHQAKALTGKDLASGFLHAGLVSYQGEKMSKSLGNLVFVSDLIGQGFSPAAIRLQLLTIPWYSDWEWTIDSLNAAQVRVEKWKREAKFIRIDADFINEAFNALKDNLNVGKILDMIEELEPNEADVDRSESLWSFLNDVLGIRV